MKRPGCAITKITIRSTLVVARAPASFQQHSPSQGWRLLHRKKRRVSPAPSSQHPARRRGDLSLLLQGLNKGTAPEAALCIQSATTYDYGHGCRLPSLPTKVIVEGS
jgi:hypothetical protein